MSNVFSSWLKESGSPLPTIIDSIGYIDYHVLTESSRTGPMVIEWTYRCCEKNENNRLYRPQIWKQNLSDPAVIRRIKDRGMYGELEHPNDGLTNLSRVSHIVTLVNYNESEDTITVRAEILDTPKGLVLQELFRKHCRVGASSRGRGTSHNENGLDVVNDDYKLETFDMVYNPSAKDAIAKRSTDQLESIQYKVGDNKVSNVTTIKERVNEILRLYPSSDDTTRDKYKNELWGLQADLGRVLKESPEMGLVAEEVNSAIKNAKVMLESMDAGSNMHEALGKPRKPSTGLRSKRRSVKNEDFEGDDEMYLGDDEELPDEDELGEDEDLPDEEYLGDDEELPDEDELGEDGEDDIDMEYQEDEELPNEDELGEDDDTPSLGERPLNLERGDIAEDEYGVSDRDEDMLLPPKHEDEELPDEDELGEDEEDDLNGEYQEDEDLPDEEYLGDDVSDDPYTSDIDKDEDVTPQDNSQFIPPDPPVDEDEELPDEELGEDGEDDIDMEYQEDEDDLPDEELGEDDEDELNGEYQEDEECPDEECLEDEEDLPSPLASEEKAALEAVRRVNNLCEGEQILPSDLDPDDSTEEDVDDDLDNLDQEEDYEDEIEADNPQMESYRAEFHCVRCGNLVESTYTPSTVYHYPIKKSCKKCGSSMVLESMNRHNNSGFVRCECGGKMRYITEASAYKCRCGRETSALESLSKGDLLLKYNEALKLISSTMQEMKESKREARSCKRKLASSLQSLSESIQRIETIKMRQVLSNELTKEPRLRQVYESLASSVSVNDLVDRINIAYRTLNKMDESSNRSKSPILTEAYVQREEKGNFALSLTNKLLESKDWE